MAPVNKIEPFVFEVIDKARKQRHKDTKIEILRKFEHWAVKDVLAGIYDDKIKFNLPPGTPPYTESQEHNAPTNLKRKHKDFRFFVKGGPGDGMTAIKRETMFIGLLEGIHPEDAKLVVQIINKEKIDGLTKNIVKEAFPGLPID